MFYKKLLLVLGILGGLAIIIFAANRIPALPEPPLKELARAHNLDLGVYLALNRLGEKQYADIATRDFDFGVIDGEPNWTFNDGALRPAPDKFDFSRVDKVLEFAKAHNMPVRIQHLVWGEDKWLPTWLKDGNYSKEQLLELIKGHINTMMARYKNDVREWTVVNEAFTRGHTRIDLHDWWADHIGPEYIDHAFIWAHQADPNAVLILNDFNSEYIGPVSDSMYSYMKGMLERHIPVNAIGMQMHIDGSNPPTKENVIANMRRFGALGLKVYVTEFDVNMNDATGTSRIKEEKQRQIYNDMLSACIESTYCHSFSILGITDKESWYNALGVPNAMPLPFDRDYRPKPAYFGLREALTK